MPTQIMTVKDTIIGGLSAGFNSFMQFIPSLLGAVIILAIGWAVSGIFARFLEKILYSVKFENVVSKAGISNYLQQAFRPDFTTTHALALLAKWFIRLIFVQAAANLLAMPQITAIINSVILFIPNLFIALIIVVFGALGAQVVGRLVEASVSRTGLTNPKVFSLISRYAILGFAFIAAVNQLGIATNLLSILFTGLVGSIALAVGLAFGLGGQGVAQDLTRSWYEQRKATGSPLKPVEGAGKFQIK